MKVNVGENGNYLKKALVAVHCPKIGIDKKSLLYRFKELIDLISAKLDVFAATL